MLTINTNLSSLIAQNSMKDSTNKLNQAIERMTTGFKINHAKDNAANYAIAQNMKIQLSSYEVAVDNVMMGMDLVMTVGEVLSAMQDHANRLYALSIQSQNGTYGAESIDAIEEEASAIIDEINRLYLTAEYNGIKLFSEDNLDTINNVAVASVYAVPSSTNTNVIYTAEEILEMTPLADDITTLSNTTKYSISTLDELVNLVELVNSGVDTTGVEFVLNSDIDLSSISEWTPIGTSNYKFCGIFDGNGHKITNLNITDTTKSSQAFFGEVNNATIKNVGLVNVNVEARHDSGGLVGRAVSTIISNCYVTGNVSGVRRVGGLSAYAESTNINNCYTICNVSNTNNEIGGLVGWADGITVNYSYALGTVTSVDSHAGGLVGRAVSSSVINNSYATGDVSGNISYIGGLVGQIESSTTISNSYATGNVRGSNYVGGLVGKAYSSSAISNCASLQSDSYATQMAQEEIKTTYSPDSIGFTEANGWTIVDGKPILSWQPEAQIGGADDDSVGSNDSSGTIGTIGKAHSVFQIGINADSMSQIEFDRAFEYDLTAVQLDISSDKALIEIVDFINLLSLKLVEIGAVENRLDSALQSIEVSISNLASSLSTIREADIAETSSTYIQQQILQQASATLLATANQSPSIALQLI